MKLSEYVIKTETEVRDNCLQAIGNLREQMAFNECQHAEIQARLQARIDDCLATISRIDKEFAD